MTTVFIFGWTIPLRDERCEYNIIGYNSFLSEQTTKCLILAHLQAFNIKEHSGALQIVYLMIHIRGKILMICQRDWVFDGDSGEVLLPWRSFSYLYGLSLRWTSSNPNLHTSRVLPYSQMMSSSHPKTWWEFTVCVWEREGHKYVSFLIQLVISTM